MTGRMAAAAAAMFVAAGAAPASAAERVASPDSSGTACTYADPCGIVHAINDANANDEVILEPGRYGSPAVRIGGPVTSMQPISVHGVDGMPRPQIFSSASFPLSLYNAASTLRHLEIDGSANAGAPVLDFRGAHAEDFVAHASNNQFACRALGRSTLRDGVCWGSGPLSIGLAESTVVQAGINPTVVNMTIIGGSGVEVDSAAGRPIAVTLVNTIAHGDAVDIALNSTSAPATLTLSHDNFRTTSVRGDDPHLDADASNQRTSDPLFESIAGDFRQRAGSPTIDHGADDPARGAFDIDGDLRTLGAGTDIGADEFVPPPVVTTGPASAVTATSATLNATVATQGREATTAFEVGPTAAYGTSQAAGTVPAGSAAPQPLSVTLTGLEPATTYHFRAGAGTTAGNATGEDSTFTTAAVPQAPPAPAPAPPLAPVLGRVTLDPPVWTEGTRLPRAARRAHVGTTIAFRSSEAVTATLTFSTARSRHLAGRLTVRAHAGLNKVRFQGRLSRRRRLRPGRYVLVVTARDGAGLTAKPRRARFTIRPAGDR